MAPPPSDDGGPSSSSASDRPDRGHDWEHAKENAAPLEVGRSVRTLSKRAFGTSAAEMEESELKSKKCEKLAKRSEKAAEWLRKKGEESLDDEGDGRERRDPTEDEARALRVRLKEEVGFDPDCSDRESVDYDPLRYWVLYVKHVRECHSSDSQRQFLLLERCARTFLSRPFLIPKYANDARFVRICVLYAEKTSNPNEVFKLMSRIKVGTKVAMFWVAWAWVAESKKDYPFAEKIFRKAIKVGPEPKEFLDKRYRHFLRRMSRHWLNASQTKDDGLDEDEEEGGREALNSLSSGDVARNDRAGGQQPQRGLGRTSSRSDRQQQQQQQRRKKDDKPAGGFDIFQDESRSSPDALDDAENDPLGAQRLARESERTKENVARPERWNERGHGLGRPPLPGGVESVGGAGHSIASAVVGPGGGGRPPLPGGGFLRRTGSGAAFDVFVDEEFVADDDDDDDGRDGAEDDEKAGQGRTLRQRLDGGAADRLARDPLRYVKCPEKVASDRRKYDPSELPEGGGGEAAIAVREEGTRRGDAERSRMPGSEVEDGRSRRTQPKAESVGPLKPEVKGRRDEPEAYCCFEERRVADRRYFQGGRMAPGRGKMVSHDADFNSLKLEPTLDANDSSRMELSESMIVDESVDMEESVDAKDGSDEVAVKPTAAKSVLKSSLRHRNPAGARREPAVPSSANPRRVLFGTNDVVYPADAKALVETSAASSGPEGSFEPVEETINTKLANAEISMMFSSPGANASLAETPGKSLLSSSFHQQPLFSTGGKKAALGKKAGSSFAVCDENDIESKGLNFSIYQEDGDDRGAAKAPSFAIHDDGKPEPSGGLNFSIHHDDTEDDGKTQERNENSRGKGHSRFGIHDESDQCAANDKEADPSFALRDGNKEGKGMNFSIYQEDATDGSDAEGKGCPASKSLPFAVHSDENEPATGAGSSSANTRLGGNGGGGFATHDENHKASGLGFAIYEEEAKCDDSRASQKPPRNSGENTASLSVIGDIMGDLNAGSKSASEKKPPTLGFSIHSDPEPSRKRSDHSSYNARGREMRKAENVVEDTASLSVIGDIMGSLKNCSVNENSKKTSRSGIAIYSDESPSKTPSAIFTDKNIQKASPKAAKSRGGSGFEIFSDEVTGSAQKKQKVAPNEPCFGDISRIEDEKTSNFQILDENDAKGNPIEYLSHHKEDMESSMRRCMKAASNPRSPCQIFDYRKKPLPKMLVRNSFTSGTKIDLLCGEITILHELGRGVYGVVLLCNDESGRSDALKIQSPIGSLSHEYSLLLSIEKRIKPGASGFYPFPRPRALYAFSEGGLFSMTAGSDSGMTLIDVTNTYKAIMGNVPELMAIYYTSRMLRHLETLHRDGKVLHADVKPDNWVLTSSPNDVDNDGANAVEGSDLMLVDFGRSIDLEKAARRGSDPLKSQFKGNVAAEDMECASMRKGRSWGIDLDFYGLAASAFILLFGSHIEVIEDRKTAKWCIRKPLRRYWQRDLWKSLFDQLLNFDSRADEYCLRDIRIAFDDYINGKQRHREIATHLNQLYTHLPKKR